MPVRGSQGGALPASHAGVQLMRWTGAAAIASASVHRNAQERVRTAARGARAKRACAPPTGCDEQQRQQRECAYASAHWHSHRVTYAR
jgi:hypothetical protein